MADNQNYRMDANNTVPDSVVTKVFDAVWEGDLSIISSYIDNGFDINPRNKSSYTLLMAAASSNNTDLIKYLITKGADVNALDNSGESALHYVAWKGNLEAVKILVGNGSDINAVYQANGGLTPLNCAAESGSLETVKYLIEHGADPDYLNEESGSSPLRSAGYKGNYEIYKYLASLNPKKYSWQEGLSHGIVGGNIDIVKFVVEKKNADVNVISNHWRTYPIQVAADNRYRSYNDTAEIKSLEIIKYLESRGARLKDINNGEIFPWAMKRSNEKTIEYYLERGFKFKAEEDMYGWPPLPAALDNGNISLAKHLLGDEKEPEFRGMPLVLFFADGLYNSPHIIDFLIKNDANKKYYPQAYLRSVANNDLESVKLLLAAGIDVNTTDAEGRNALYYVSDVRTGTYLIEQGINTADPVVLKSAWNNFPLLSVLIDKEVDIPAEPGEANESLRNAARLGNVILVNFFLEKGAQVNSYSTEVIQGRNDVFSGRTALMENAIQGYTDCYSGYVSGDVANILIKAGADADLKDSMGRTALHHASAEQYCRIPIWPIPMGSRRDREQGAHGDPAMPPMQQHDLIVRALIDTGAKLDEQDAQGNTPLLLATINGNTETMKMLLEAGAETGIKNKEEKDIFDYTGNADIILVMKDAGLLNKIPGETINNAFIRYIYNSNYEFDKKSLETFIENGVDINCKVDGNDNALMYYMEKSYDYNLEEKMQCLIGLGIDINAQNRNDKTILMSAVEKRRPKEILEFLLENGADFEKRDNSNMTAYTIARVIDNPDAALLLEKAGAKRDLYAEWWLTIYKSHSEDSLEKIRKLMDEGVDINTKTNYIVSPNWSDEIKDCGMTALMYSVTRRGPDIVRGLIGLGADPDIRDNNGKTALMYAREVKSQEKIDILLAAGAKDE